MDVHRQLVPFADREMPELITCPAVARNAAGLIGLITQSAAPFFIAWTADATSRSSTSIKNGVCERCALLASRDGRIIVPKIVADGVTVAIAEDNPKQQTDNERT